MLRPSVSDHDPTDLEQQDERDDLRRVSARLASENESEDFVWLMSGPKGRRFVRRLLNRAGIFRTSYHPNALEMSRQEGEKQIGYWILEQVDRLCPAEYHTMMQENRNGRTVASH